MTAGELRRPLELLHGGVVRPFQAGVWLREAQGSERIRCRGPGSRQAEHGIGHLASRLSIMTRSMEPIYSPWLIDIRAFHCIAPDETCSRASVAIGGLLIPCLCLHDIPGTGHLSRGHGAMASWDQTCPTHVAPLRTEQSHATRRHGLDALATRATRGPTRRRGGAERQPMKIGTGLQSTALS